MSHLLFDGLGLVPLALAFNRIALGVFFVTSGYHKLFNRSRHRTIDATMVDDGIPFPHLFAWVVPVFEFVGGALLAVGIFAPAAAFSLFVICLVATCSDGLKRIPSYHPLDVADWVCDLLYLPEVLYCTMLAVVFLAGPGYIVP